jgi:TonB dependent receptor
VSPAQFNNTGTPGQFGTRSLYITVDGGRASSTNYVLDGVYVRSLRFNVLSMQPSVETLQEFNLLRSSFSTEYGQGQAAVSMVTKSGSNQIHGSLFEYTRSSIFDARNYFSTYAQYPHKPVFHRNQFGGTIGAPIVKDKIFIFAGYEGLRSSQSIPQVGNFPTQAQLGTPTYLFAQVLQPSFPVPNCTSCGTNNYSVTAIEPNNYDQGVIRSDQTLSSKHTLFERYVYYTASEIVPTVQNGTSYPQLGHNVSVGDTYLISPTIVNEVRLGYNRAYGFTNQVNPVPGRNWVQEAGLQNISGGVTPSEYGRPTVTITGYTGLGEAGNSQGDTENIYSIGDTVSDVIGKHTLRAGAQFQWRQIRQLTDTPARGSFTFASLAADQAGVCSICQAGSGSSLGHYTDNTYGIFMNGIWQLGHRVTVNYGLQWEYASPFVEKNGLAGMFDPNTGLITFHKVPSNIPAVLLPHVNTTPNFFPAGMVQPDKRGFGPRLGLAFQASPGTVARIGYGVYFDNTNINELQFQRNIPPFYFNATINNASFITQTPMPGLNQLPSIPAPFSLYPGNRNPYTQEWTVSVQQDLGHSTVLELGYTGSVTHKLWKRFDQNEDTFAQVGGMPRPRPFPNLPARHADQQKCRWKRFQRTLGQARAAQPQRLVLSCQLSVVEKPGQQFRRSGCKRHFLLHPLLLRSFLLQLRHQQPGRGQCRLRAFLWYWQAFPERGRHRECHCRRLVGTAHCPASHRISVLNHRRVWVLHLRHVCSTTDKTGPRPNQREARATQCGPVV